MSDHIDKFLGTGPKPAAPIAKEKPDAPEERPQPEGDQREHPDGDEGGAPAEAGDSHRDAEGGKTEARKKRKAR